MMMKITIQKAMLLCWVINQVKFFHGKAVIAPTIINTSIVFSIETAQQISMLTLSCVMGLCFSTWTATDYGWRQKADAPKSNYTEALYQGLLTMAARHKANY